ncbi:uncharacterized protein G2W53_016318 [Senna tora]|uniref:Uncharacterized protein n=1 Tax=Senna tora TaxID=362788 RepID=A0A834WQ36_9FABA|nr:uncharacterized protein G2W53_016318 [Senna tora]
MYPSPALQPPLEPQMVVLLSVDGETNPLLNHQGNSQGTQQALGPLTGTLPQIVVITPVRHLKLRRKPIHTYLPRCTNFIVAAFTAATRIFPQ